MDSSKNIQYIEPTLGFIGLMELYTMGLQPMAIHIKPLCGYADKLNVHGSYRFAIIQRIFEYLLLSLLHSQKKHYSKHDSSFL